MALDPQARAVLDLIIKVGRPSYDRLSPVDARQQYRETRTALQLDPPDMSVVKDLSAEGPAGPIPLRLYRPLGAAGNAALPGLIYFHGGGWVIGDLDTHDVLCRQLAEQSGLSVVAVDYRLAPENKFPAAVDDCWAATRWIAAHAAELGLDARRLAVGGDSAGGTLAAVIAVMARDAGQPALAFQLLIYPATDMKRDAPSHAEFADGYLLTRNTTGYFTGHYVRSDADLADWRASPIQVPSLHGLPPALIITAGFDPLRDEGEAYAQRLRDAGVTVDYLCYGGMIHGFLPMGRALDTATRAVAHAAASVRQALRSKEPSMKASAATKYEVDVEDVEYLRHGDRPLLARLYKPRGTGPFPLIVDLHGGAWCRGDRLGDAAINEPLAASGVVVAALDFRMPPDASYPASIADINYAIRWLKTRATGLNSGPDRVGVIGISSGGHQGMLLAMRPRDPRYAALPLRTAAADVDASVRCVVLCWPVIDPLARYRYAKNLKAGGKPYPEIVDRVLPAHDEYWKTEEAMAEGNPVLALERGERVELPPALYLQGTADVAHPRPDLERFVTHYRKAGGHVELEMFEGEAEGFVTKNPGSPNARRAIDKIIEFVHQQLG